jgi:hypothetical protein
MTRNEPTDRLDAGAGEATRAVAGNITHRGACHCGAVAFEVDAPADLTALECNCSICRMTGFLHLIVPRSRFRLLRGAEALAEYRFNTGTARHLFCRHCGVKSFYVPRSNPDGFSVNVRCLEGGTLASVAVQPFDDNDRERSESGVRHLSQG